MQYDAASSASSTTARTDAVNASPVVVAKAELLRPPRMSLMEGDLSSNPALRSRMDSLLKEVRCKLIHGPSCAPFSGVSANVHRKIFWCSLHVACVVRDRLGSSLRRTMPAPKSSPEDAVQLEKLISTNRSQAAEISDLTRKAAEREAKIAQLQVQLTQAKMQVSTAAKDAAQQAAQQAQAEREQLLTQHHVLLQQVYA